MLNNFDVSITRSKDSITFTITMRIFLVLTCFLIASSMGRAQTTQGSFCLEYFQQPLVETYVDSLVSYLTKEMSGENEIPDSTTLDYIQHFASLATRESKCVYFSSDSILVQEKVDDELTNPYLILPAENKLISRSQAGGLVQQPYFLESSSELGEFKYVVEEDKTDSKLIEGFLCYRVEVTEFFTAPGEDTPREKKYILYVTDDIEVAGGFILGVNMSRIIGCPLEVQEPLNSKIRITYRATGLRLNVPDGIFQSL